MSGFFGVASKEDCIFDLFFGTDYHSHLGTRRAGMTVYHQKEGFHRAIHNIENTPFRTKFDKDLNNLSGHLGIGCISDYEPQPLLIRSHHGTYAIMTIGKINNIDTIVDKIMNSSPTHFFELSGGSDQPERKPDRGHSVRAGYHRRFHVDRPFNPQGNLRSPRQAGTYPDFPRTQGRCALSRF